MSTRSEIESRLGAWAGAQTPPIPVALQNITFDRPVTGPYLEIFFLDKHAENRSVSAEGTRTTGRFQINCYAPVNRGMVEVDKLVASVIALYPVIPKTGTVSIESPLDESTGIVVDGFMCVPVTGKYRVETY